MAQKLDLRSLVAKKEDTVLPLKAKASPPSYPPPGKGAPASGEELPSQTDLDSYEAGPLTFDNWPACFVMKSSRNAIEEMVEAANEEVVGA